jgi:hypothetical protein
VSTTTLEMDTAPTESKPKEKRNPLAEFLARHPRILAVGWAFAILLLFSTFPALYFAWYVAPQTLWSWALVNWWHAVLALLAGIGLLVVPFLPFGLAIPLIGSLAETTLKAAESDVTKAQYALRQTEREALEQLEKSDEPGLLPLLKYSRAQLEAYYAVGIGQARRSFLNSVLAMWLGFIVLLAGLAYEQAAPYLGSKVPPTEFRNLTLGAGAIIEFISAAFLWVYRSATVQLTNFYNRQMQTHTSVLCFRIASTIKEPTSQDQGKITIVDTILRGTVSTGIPPLPGAKGKRKPNTGRKTMDKTPPA